MEKIVKKSLDNPDETKTFEKFKNDVVTVDGITFQSVTAQPGWRWSKHTKPVVGGESCQVRHLIYVLDGKLKTKLNDGTEMEFSTGDIGVIPPGHDGWNPGTKPAVWIDITRSTP